MVPGSNPGGRTKKYITSVGLVKVIGETSEHSNRGPQAIFKRKNRVEMSTFSTNILMPEVSSTAVRGANPGGRTNKKHRN